MEEKQDPSPTVMSVSLKFGLIMAVISIATMMIKIALGVNPYDRDWSGWVSIIIVIVLVVFAHKSFKEDGDGYMSFGQGFGIGTLSMLISVVVSGIFSMLYSSFIDQGLLDQILQKTEEQMREQGQNEQAIEIALEWTKKLFWPIYFFFGGIMAVIVGLVVTIFTQKKSPEAIV